MTTQEIAERLAELCRLGEFTQAQTELFAADALSIEPHATPAFEKETKGLEAIEAKGKKWAAMTQTHNIDVAGPLVAGSSIALTMKLDVTMHDGKRMTIEELCLYKVSNGKIVTEQFFM